LWHDLGYGKQRQKKSRSKKAKTEETHYPRESATTPRRSAATHAGRERTWFLIAVPKHGGRWPFRQNAVVFLF
jgi:hypothetical protein